MRLLSALLALVLLVALVPPAVAQSCALCRAAAEASDDQGAQALNLAVLVLLFPTISIFVGILVFAFRYRNRSSLSPPADDDSDDFSSLFGE